VFVGVEERYGARAREREREKKKKKKGKKGEERRGKENISVVVATPSSSSLRLFPQLFHFVSLRYPKNRKGDNSPIIRLFITSTVEF